ncbi:monovalent cation:proton antiporter-2 (CPA2) family protein [Lautropia mirabilis]|uniref:monovalent cation:proton antiporter-2 (CPA2) family protein n=1 Tax=Lautropia mirabilis TaxID=47671 RepID=UPI00234A9421|nr:monovalent cation:proton antiporter-2 (CPA2) family protein [Lautropia mirabilis]MDC6092671.1 monovalent cation:proton antiporter-2 (CPA2) family protein [Lautropia mirabilis]
MAAEGSSFDLIQVVSLLGAAVVAVPLFKRLGLGSVLGYLAAGLAIGPYGLAVVTDSHSIIHIAEFGVVMFLFVIGLEMKPSHLWGLRRQIFGLGSLQVVISAILLTIVGTLFGASWAVSFICASGFVLTSTAIVMQVLGERQELASPRGQRIVSILLFEDLLIVPLLAIVEFLAPGTPDGAAHATPLWQTIGIALLSLSALVAAGLWVLNPLFRVLAASRAREVMTAAALLVVLGSGLLMEMGGLSMAMGAFVAGVLLSESSFRHQLEADIEPFRGLLLGLFFLGVGMSLDLKVVAENWGIIVSGVIALMVVKGLCVYGVARLARSNHADALDRALLMAQGGEFAFVLYAAAANAGVIDATVNANMTAIIVLSMAITPLILILHRRFAAQPAETREADTFDEHHPILVVGMGRFGQIVNSMLQMSGHSTTVIDLDPTTVAGFNRYGTKTHFGDASRPELLLAAGIENTRLLVIAIDNREQALSIARFAREVNPNIDIVARAYDRLHTFDLYQAGADEIVRETFDAAIRAGKRALERLGMSRDDAEKVGKIFYRHDRHGMIEQARVYDPTLGPFKNQQMAELVMAQRQDTREAVQAALRGEEEEWPHGDD